MAAFRTVLFAFASAGASIIKSSSWECSELNSTVMAGGDSNWTQLNCTATLKLGSDSAEELAEKKGPIVINVVSVDLRDGSRARIEPAASPNGTLSFLSDIGSLDSSRVAGVNGGYYYRMDDTGFKDGVCKGKTRADAEMPATASHPNRGLGDASLVSNGILLSSNCDCRGYNMPAVLTVNGTRSRIDLVGKGGAPPAGLELDSVAGGPLILKGGRAIGPDLKDENAGHFFEHAGNAGMGLSRPLPSTAGTLLTSQSGRPSTAWMVTFDGYDGCPFTDTTCGTTAFVMAAFFRDYLGAWDAMSMDQGGSTGMYVKGQGSRGGAPGMVNRAHKEPDSAPRTIFSGVFVSTKV